MRVGDSDFTLTGLFSLSQSQWASWTRERGLWGTLRQTCLGIEIGPNVISRVSFPVGSDITGKFAHSICFSIKLNLVLYRDWEICCWIRDNGLVLRQLSL